MEVIIMILTVKQCQVIHQIQGNHQHSGLEHQFCIIEAALTIEETEAISPVVCHRMETDMKDLGDLDLTVHEEVDRQAMARGFRLEVTLAHQTMKDKQGMTQLGIGRQLMALRDIVLVEVAKAVVSLQEIKKIQEIHQQATKTLKMHQQQLQTHIINLQQTKIQ